MIRIANSIHSQIFKSGESELIDTGIYPTTATTFRVRGIAEGYYQGGSVVGFHDNDSNDYRMFFTDTLYFDWGNDRLEARWYDNFPDNPIDLTCSNYKIYDNIRQTTFLEGSQKTSVYHQTIKVDVSCWRFKQLEIWDGDTLVFDGKGAVDTVTGHIGIYDSISQTLKYNPNLNMTFDGFAHTFASDKSSISFEISGGTESLTISAETSWSCTTPTFATFSSTSGESGITTITITCPENQAFARNEIITFTDSDNFSFNLNIRQKGQGGGIGSKIFIGEENIASIYFMGDIIQSIFIGEEQIYTPNSIKNNQVMYTADEQVNPNLVYSSYEVSKHIFSDETGLITFTENI